MVIKQKIVIYTPYTGSLTCNQLRSIRNPVLQQLSTNIRATRNADYFNNRMWVDFTNRGNVTRDAVMQTMREVFITERRGYYGY